MNIPITQSNMWAKLQHDLGETCFLTSNSDYHFLAILKSTPVGKYLYLPYGPVAETEEAFQAAISALRELAISNNAIFLRLEPQDTHLTLPKSAKKVTDLNPRETWILDLPEPIPGRPSEATTRLGTLPSDLLDKLPSRLLRYYKSAGKKGITITTSHHPPDVSALLTLQRNLAAEKGINTFSEHYLETELAQSFATLYLVHYSAPDEALSAHIRDSEILKSHHQDLESPHKSHRASEDQHRSTHSHYRPAPTDVETPHSSQIIAAGLVFDDSKTRYNLQGAQSDLGRELHATGILTIQLILDAYEKGLRHFDFWGIAPEGAPPTHPWAGFTAFKKTFAGRPVAYQGDYDIVLNPLKYRLYQSLRQINRKIRK